MTFTGTCTIFSVLELQTDLSVVLVGAYSFVRCSFETFMKSHFNIKFHLFWRFLFCFYMISVQEKVCILFNIKDMNLGLTVAWKYQTLQASFDVSMRPSTHGLYYRYGSSEHNGWHYLIKIIPYTVEPHLSGHLRSQTDCPDNWISG